MFRSIRRPKTRGTGFQPLPPGSTGFQPVAPATGSTPWRQRQVAWASSPWLPATRATSRPVAGRVALLVLCWLGVAAALPAQEPSVHYWHHGVMPPGAIGNMRLQRGGPVAGFYQPVEVRAPQGTLVSFAAAGEFEAERPAPRTVGLLIGAVYRLRVTHIRLAEGLEVYPTHRGHRSALHPAGPRAALRHPHRSDRRGPAAGAGRQVRHAGDLPRRPADGAAGAGSGVGAELVRRRTGPGPAGGGRRIGPAGGHSAFGRPRAGPRPGSLLLFGFPPLVSYPPVPALLRKATTPPASPPGGSARPLGFGNPAASG